MFNVYKSRGRRGCHPHSSYITFNIRYIMRTEIDKKQRQLIHKFQ